ncbi:hypothetical protein [Bradyrhizobium diazoefficiens]|nr:hypothetical protein [Bradyrhizobium diazoefficiens]AND87810.1 hypothetical protein AAV28_08330 [Bradyrhizobium diazoefficiens USDA 110]QLD45935.1 hypothetical protein HUW42_35305 [Bradyrhizobium diazoefficiens]WLA72268.1 hypothetical protein QIH77_36130 [Bradyrhizobium diazoefficiens]
MIKRPTFLIAAIAISLSSSQLARAQAPGFCAAPSAVKAITDPGELRTVIVTDATVLKNPKVDFSFGRTLGAIISSFGGVADSPAARLGLLSSMINSFNDKSDVNPESRIALPLTPRPGEVGLDPSKMMTKGDPDEMRIVGLFNRLDLAPADWKYCGEHRIVYEKGNPVSPTNRLTIIFEAALDNPEPQKGGEGCKAVAEFWDGLKGKSGDELATQLEMFYFKGLAGKTRPVVHYLQYGLPFGQVRANLFVNQPKFLWQLREWHLRPNADGTLNFVPDTVKANALPSLYGQAIAGEDPRLAALRQQFSNELIATYVDAIADTDEQALSKGSKATLDTLLFKMGVPISDKYNTFESTASGSDDDPLVNAQKGGGLLPRIKPKLDSAKLSQGCSMTSEQILNRIGAQSCGGCHHFSGGKSIASLGPGTELKWPDMPGFVHIDENGDISILLKDFFLPSRRQNLIDFLKAPAAPQVSASARSFDDFRTRLAEPGSLSTTDTDIRRSDLRTADKLTEGAFTRFRSAD